MSIYGDFHKCVLKYLCNQKTDDDIFLTFNYLDQRSFLPTMLPLNSERDCSKHSNILTHRSIIFGLVERKFGNFP